jgi:succinate-acetate transporter protein
MNNKSVSTATIGYMAYALTFWLIGVSEAGWTHGSNGGIWAIAFPLTVLLLVVGILAVANERTLDGIVFLGGMALIWSGHSFVRLAGGAHSDVTSGFEGWFWLMWVAFYAWVFNAALKDGTVRALFLLGVALTFLALTIAAWASLHVLVVVAGYLFLATAVLAAAVSACAINSHAGAGHLKESGAP